MLPPVTPLPAIPRLSNRHRAMLLEMGVPVWWPEIDERAPQAPPVVVAPPVAAPRPAPKPPVIPMVPAADFPDLGALEAAVRGCARCGLSSSRQCAVPGMGDGQPDWLIVGEAPGEEEDRQGLPFVGRAGQLLDRMLAAMDLTRDQKVYIANVIKCRPPMNRNPDPAEIAACSPYLLRQIQLLRPRMVLAMGRFAAQTLLIEGGVMPRDAIRQMPLGKLRGVVHLAQLGGHELPVVVTYHPAYLLRSPAEKAKAWADLCLAMDTMDQRAGMARSGSSHGTTQGSAEAVAGR